MSGRAISIAACSAIFTVTAAGCTSITERPGFDQVQEAAATRTEKEVHWYQGTAEDQAIREKVDGLLDKELSAGAAVQIALLNNRRLQATYEDLGVAQADLVQAGLPSNPMFDGELLFPLSGGESVLELAVAQNFLDIFMIPLRKQVASAEFEAAKHRVTGAVIDLAADTRVAYYRVVAANERLALLRQVVKARSASHEAMQRLHDAGNVTRLDVSSSRLSLERARLALNEAELRAMAERERLTRLLGVWGPRTEYTVGDRLPELPESDPDLAAVEKMAIRRSLDLAAARKRLEAAARRTGATKATQLLPEFEAGAVGEREEGEWGVGPSVEFPIPLFDQGQARVAGATARFRRQWDHYTDLAIRIRSVARETRQRVLAARAAAEHSVKVVRPLHTDVLQRTQKQYNAMQIGVFRLLRAKERQVEAAAQSIRTLRDYWLARTRLEQLLNGRLPTGAAALEAPAPGGESPDAPDAEGGHS